MLSCYIFSHVYTLQCIHDQVPEEEEEGQVAEEGVVHTKRAFKPRGTGPAMDDPEADRFDPLLNGGRGGGTSVAFAFVVGGGWLGNNGQVLTNLCCHQRYHGRRGAAGVAAGPGGRAQEGGGAQSGGAGGGARGQWVDVGVSGGRRAEGASIDVVWPANNTNQLITLTRATRSIRRRRW